MHQFSGKPSVTLTPVSLSYCRVHHEQPKSRNGSISRLRQFAFGLESQKGQRGAVRSCRHRQICL
jgi:hypothetical protein